MSKNRHHGSSLDEFLAGLPSEEQIAIQAGALKIEICQLLRKAMKEQSISARRLQQLMQTSPSQIQRILSDDYTGVALRNVSRAFDVLGLRLHVTVSKRIRRARNEAFRQIDGKARQPHRRVS